MRKYIAAILLMLSGLGFISQAAETATSILDKAAAKINSARSLTADYTISSGSASEKGHIVLSAGKFSLSSKSLYTWYDGLTLWTYSPSLNEVNITTPTAEELLEINPFAVINNYKAAYTPRLLSSAGNKYKIELTPKQKRASIAKAILTIDAASYYPRHIDLTMPDHSVVSIAVESVSAGKTLPVNSFTLDPSIAKDAEIIDLR